MFRAVGFVVLLVAIRLIMPPAFDALENALVSALELANQVFDSVPTDIASQFASLGSSNYVPKPAPLPSAMRVR